MQKRILMLKAELIKLLSSVRLDKVYHKALGNELFYTEDNKEYRVLDLVGGFGTTLLGHNNPEIKDAIYEFLTADRAIHSQGSLRLQSQNLANKLSRLASSNKKYRCILANSGAETVEAAIKHAELCKRKNLIKIKNQVDEKLYDIKIQYKKLNFENPEFSLLDFEKFQNFILKSNETVFNSKTVFISLRKGFHGKTSGAVQLTHNKDYRNLFLNLGPIADFCDYANHEETAKTFKKYEQEILIPIIDKNQIKLEKISVTQIAGFIFEPIQGEGGIHVIPAKDLRYLSELTKYYKIPMIADEIQSGMGRTGKFLATQHTDIEPDYILLSKSLGGGIVKIGALLVAEDFYASEFSMIQTSTFAEDELSSTVADKALDILFAHDSRAMIQIEDTSKKIFEIFEKLQSKYPGVIKEIRGRGLMIGIEFEPWEERASFLMRITSVEKKMSTLMCGYLLHECSVRILPTLSDPNTIRIEPSLYLTDVELIKIENAFNSLCACIADSHDGKLMRYLMEKEKKDITVSKSIAPLAKSYEEPLPGAKKVAFLAHFPSFNSFKVAFGGFPDLSTEDCKVLTDRLKNSGVDLWHGISRNFLIQNQSVNFNVFSLNYTTERLLEEVKNGNRYKIKKLINSAIDQAVEAGCEVVGLGMFTSIVTRNGLDLKRDDVKLTSGNSLTTALGVDAVLRLMEEKNLFNQTYRKLAVVGAAGNIAQALIRQLAPYFNTVELVGSDKLDSLERLKTLAMTLKPKGNIKPQRFQDNHLTMMHTGPSLADYSNIQLSQNLDNILDADVIVTATSSHKPLLFPQHLKENAIVCDISYPVNVDKSVLETRPDVRIIQGGLGLLPDNQIVDVPFSTLKGSQIYACMAETMLLGLNPPKEHFSYGDLEDSKIEWIRHLFYEKGFKLTVDKSWHTS